MEISNRDYQVRGRSTVHQVDQVEALVVGRSREGKPIRLRDIGYVQVGFDLRRGIVDLDGRGEHVGGIVVMRQGENALRLIERVRQKIPEVERAPHGVLNISR